MAYDLSGSPQLQINYPEEEGSGPQFNRCSMLTPSFHRFTIVSQLGNISSGLCFG